MTDISVIGNSVVGRVQSTTPQAKDVTVEVTTSEATIIEGSDHKVVQTDRVEFSERAKWLEKIHQLPEVRQEQIDTFKEAIANNAYLTDEKLQVAFERLIEEVAK